MTRLPHNGTVPCLSSVQDLDKLLSFVDYPKAQ